MELLKFVRCDGCKAMDEAGEEHLDAAAYNWSGLCTITVTTNSETLLLKSARSDYR